MVDIVSAETRSRMMSGIRGKDTRAEIAIRKQLFALGYRYRLHARGLPGSPDLVFPKYKAVVFVHGCFWHRHGCPLTTTPSSNTDFWQTKFNANRERDGRVLIALRQKGWRIALVWECAVASAGLGQKELARLSRWIRSGPKSRAKLLEIPAHITQP
jgi:DNA mismatch endonuclease, patch repair protein